MSNTPPCQVDIAGFKHHTWLGIPFDVTFSRVTGLYSCDVSVKGDCYTQGFADYATFDAAILYCEQAGWKAMSMEEVSNSARYSYGSYFYGSRYDKWNKDTWQAMTTEGDGIVEGADFDAFKNSLNKTIEHTSAEALTCDVCFTTKGSFKDMLHCIQCPSLVYHYSAQSCSYHVCRSCIAAPSVVELHSTVQCLIRQQAHTPHSFLDPRKPQELASILESYKIGGNPMNDLNKVGRILALDPFIQSWKSNDDSFELVLVPEASPFEHSILAKYRDILCQFHIRSVETTLTLK